MTTLPKRILSLSLLCLLAWIPPAGADETARFLEKQKLPDGQTVVVAEGDFEPRSMGSYSVRLYAKNDEFPTDQFLSGVIAERDGAIEVVSLEDIDGDAAPEVIVKVRSAGTGGYQSGAAFTAAGGKLVMVAKVADLEKDADVTAALKDALSKSEKK